MDSKTDMELIDQARGGDPQSFSMLVSRNYMIVYKYAYRWCGSREDAEDITQEVFIKIAGKLHLFENKSLFTTWLYRITANCAKDFLRKKNRWNKTIQTDQPTSENIVSPNPGPENNTIARNILEVIARLPTKLKEAALLVYAEDMSHKEAAKIIGCAETTVSWRIFQAKKRLRKVLS
jgi:RNA polymerase sigma-70 factor (ECF subfamily)